MALIDFITLLSVLFVSGVKGVSCTQIKALQMTTKAMASLWTNLNVITSVCLLYACYASGQYCLLSGSDDTRNCLIFSCNPPPELPTFPDFLNINEYAASPTQHDCVNAQCINTVGSFTFMYNTGFSNPSGDGKTCIDITKCPPCVNGKPNRLPDESWNCTCDPGFSNPSGDGKICTDINECAASPTQHDCVNAQCINTVGSFTCMCNTGFSNPSGDGKTCIDFNECTGQSPQNDCVNAQCINTNGSYTCNCNTGYNNVNMDGKTCIDNEPPVFTNSLCHMAVNKVADPSSLTSSVTWNDPQASDTTGKSPIVTCSPGSGTHFTIGQTDVTCTAKDDAGNYAVINCTFMVTVTDFDECSADVNGDNCHNYANCTNIDGGFLCDCTAGYIGNGVICTANDQTNNTAVIAVVSVVGTAFTIVLIACGVRMWRKKRTPKNNRPKRTTVEMDEVDYEVTMPEDGIALTVYEDIGLPSWALRWEIRWKNLVVEDTVLGQGNFGEVRSGTVNIDGKITKTAIKVLKGHTSKTDREDFMEEFRTMTNIGYHPNVVSLLGACPHEDDLYVALEYLPKGDLRSYLRRDRLQSDSDEGALSSTQLIKFALDIAKGMKHLAMSGVIHRDLAARNILLNERLVAKVSDFGLSRGQDIYVQTSMRRVPTRWLAIESLIDHTYTTQSDVWSFGILLWEIASIGGTPYPSIASKSLTDELKGGYRMSKPPNCDDKIYSLMLRCWEEDPSHRPTFSDLVRILREMDDNKIEHTYLIIDRSGCENFSVIRPDLDDN